MPAHLCRLVSAPFGPYVINAISLGAGNLLSQGLNMGTAYTLVENALTRIDSRCLVRLRML